MLPIVEPDGRSTSLRILLYSLALIPVSMAGSDTSRHGGMDLFRKRTFYGDRSAVLRSSSSGTGVAVAVRAIETACSATIASNSILPANPVWLMILDTASS